MIKLTHFVPALLLMASTWSPLRAAAQQPTQPGWPQPMHNNLPFGYTVFNQNEIRARGDERVWRWDSESWYGGNINRFWIRSEGSLDTRSRKFDDAEAQALYSHAISPFFNLQTGARYAFTPGPSNGSAVFGVEGLAPLNWEVGAFAFISTGGHYAARIEGNYDLLLTQRLILQPQFEINFHSKDDARRGIGAGLSDLDSGIRLRYEIKRQFAPYIGLTFTKKYGRTADMAALKGAITEELRFTAGIRIWF